MENKSELYRDKYIWTPLLLILCFFYILGGTLGSGIMVVPTELSRSGFWTYFLILILPLIGEIFTALVFLQILQKVRKSLTNETHEENENISENNRSHKYENILSSKPITEDDENEGKNESLLQSNKKDEDILSTHKTIEEEKNKEKKKQKKSKLKTITSLFMSKGIDLHTIGSSYFKWYYVLFLDLIIFALLVPIPYAIGISQTLVQYFIYIGSSTDPDQLISTSSEETETMIMKYAQFFSIFVCIFGFLIVFVISSLVEILASFLTCMKASLLIFVIFLGLLVSVVSSSSSNNSVFSSFSNILLISRPFFAQSMLINGSIFLIPQLFSKLFPSKKNMIYFSIAVVLGLICSQIVALLWVICVFQIVPQNGENGADINLSNSLENSELANIPFSLVIEEFYPGFAWLGSLVEIFTAISLIVCFLIYTSVVKSMIDGYIKQGSILFHCFHNKNEIQISEINNNNNNLGDDVDVPYQPHHQHQQLRPKNKKKIKGLGFFLLFSTQLFVYLMVAAFCSVFCYVIYNVQYFLYELLSFGLIVFNLFYVVGLAVSDIFINPLEKKKNGRKLRIWWELPRWLYITMSIFVGVYFLSFSLWFYTYSTISWIYTLKDSQIPF